MQVFRLVEVGLPDKVIAFDSLPERMVADIELGEPTGLPKFWQKFLPKVKRIYKGEYEKQPDGKVIKNLDIIEEKPSFYILEYKAINKDREKWQEIVNFLRRVVDVKLRLLDKIEDMAIPMAADSKTELTLEPDQIPIIPIAFEFQEKIALPSQPNNSDDDTIMSHAIDCYSKGHGGKYSPEGKCKRCDQLRNKDLASVAS